MSRAVRLAALALLAVPSAGAARAQPADTPPSTPGGLVASAYSGTAGAIRWQRSTDDRGAVPGYEIARDGTVLGVFDALSYVDRSLSPGRSYRYTVTAIDNAGQRSGAASVRLATPGGGGGDGGSAPAAPTGLRAEVYSGRNAELFWDRPATFGLRYEVRRDGETVATTDGVSYYDDTLAAETRYRYEVIAIDRAGRRSTATAVELLTRGGSGGGGGSTPAAPAGLRAEVYSSRNAELFWNRPDVVGLRYEVRRDGETVATTDGVSYYDDTLAAGTTYGYEVIAVDRSGRRSAPAAVTLSTAGGGTSNPSPPPVGPPVAPELPSRVLVRLQTVFDIANFDQLERVGALARALNGVEDGALPGFTVKRFATNDVGTENTTLACPGGGQVDVVVLGGTTFANPPPFYVATDCRVGPLAFDGRIDGPQRPDANGDFPSDDVGARRLTLSDSRDGSVVTIEAASLSSNSTGNPNPLADRFGYQGIRAVDFDPDPARSALSLRGTARPYVLTGRDNSSSTRGVPAGQRFVENGFFGTEFEARIGADEGVTTVTTLESFADLDARGNFASGKLEIAGPGYRYLLDADGGSATSFRLDATEDGATVSYDVPWSDDLRFDPFEPGSVDLGI